MTNIELRARLIASLYFDSAIHTELWNVLYNKIIAVQNALLDEAADTAENIDNGHYTSMKTAAEAIRAMKVK